MARICFCAIILAIFFVDFAISVDPPTVAPSRAPEIAADGPSGPASDTGAPASSPSDSPFSSPPSPSAPSPDLGASPGSSPAPSPDTAPSSVPVPAPSESDISPNNVKAEEDAYSKSGGMSSGKKAGIAFAVFAAAGLVVGASCVVKKRRENERRAQYGYAMRREIL